MTNAVLGVPPYLQFFDDNGDPLSGGFIYTYAAGTSFSVPKATYTDSTGAIPADNPIELDSSGIPDTANGSMWLIGSYKFKVTDSLGNTIRTTDNVSSFTTLAEASDPYFQSFSGNGTNTAFTTSEDLGTEEKGLMIYVDSGTPTVIANGDFASDTIWTKGAGWTIAAGVATAAGAISTAISQNATVTLVAGLAYNLVYTITRSAGGLIPSIGGQNGTERTASGTYRETIVAGSSQAVAFTGNAFTGTLDNVSVSLANSKGYEILPPTAYTISGTSLSFATAPASGTNNIYVFAPSLLLGAASAAAGAAEASATAALASEVAAATSASSAAAYAAAKNQWTFSTTTTMANPTTGFLRLNNATIASATQIAISDLSANSGNPDLGSWIDTWDDAGGTNRGSIFIFVDNSNFAIFNVNSAVTDNTSWHQVPVTYVAGAGTISNNAAILIGFSASGTTTVTGGITALTGDVTASGSGSVAATIANDAVTFAKMQNAIASSKLVGSGASGIGANYEEITLGTNLSMSGTTLNASSGGAPVVVKTASASSTLTFTSSDLDFTNNLGYDFEISNLDVDADTRNVYVYASTDNMTTPILYTNGIIFRATGTTLTAATDTDSYIMHSLEGSPTYNATARFRITQPLTTAQAVFSGHSVFQNNSAVAMNQQFQGQFTTSAVLNSVRIGVNTGTMTTATVVAKPIPRT